jgi:hypothetical protein
MDATQMYVIQQQVAAAQPAIAAIPPGKTQTNQHI